MREGQEIDPERLSAFVRQAVPDLPDEPLTVGQFGLGYSNLTYLVRVGAREMVLRRPPVGVVIASAHDMGREFRILSHLAPVYDKAPTPIVFCEDEELIGTPFYLMERVQGVILRKEMPEAMRPEPALARSVAEGLVETLAELHAVDVEAAGLGTLGRPGGYVGRQIEGWTKRYRHAETETIPEADAVARWLLDSMPTESGSALIHNDFKHDNLVLDPSDWSRVIAILDWEMATLGDPLMDLGTTLAYWTQPDDPPELREARLSPTLLPGTPGRAEIVEWYERASGRPVEHVTFYFAYGLFKVAVIVQQLYARYVAGRTADPRFADLISGVRALSRLAARAIELDRVDDLG